jgi:hypothetical protein
LQNASEKESEQSPRKGLAAPAFCFKIKVVQQNKKLLEHNRFERKFQQLTFPMDITRLFTEILIRCIFYYENRAAAKFLFCSSPFDFHGGGNRVKSEHIYFICGMLVLLLNFESKI